MGSWVLRLEARLSLENATTQEEDRSDDLFEERWAGDGVGEMGVARAIVSHSSAIFQN